MKPTVFIGSSTEGLPIAYAIQENLEYDANITVWTQGIFKPSGTTIVDLLNVASSFNFAVFVFSADDISVIRQNQHSVVRDNVIFELGLFIGKLGRERVFYVIPRDVNDLHLPSDLVGVTPGTYDSERKDNTVAALGTFCNQIRPALKAFVYESLEYLAGEKHATKKLVVEKPSGWEFFLFADILEKRLAPLNSKYSEIQNELVFLKTRALSGIEFFNWFGENLADMKKYAILFNKLIATQLEEAFGKPGEPGDPLKIKDLAGKFYALAKELVKWEKRLEKIKPPDELLQVKSSLQGWGEQIFEQIVRMPTETRRVIVEKLNNPSNTEKLAFTISIPEKMHEALDCFNEYFDKTGVWPNRH